MELDIRAFSSALTDLVDENYELRRQVALAELDLDPSPEEDEGTRSLERVATLSTAREVEDRQQQVVQIALEEWSKTVMEPPRGEEYERIGREYIRGKYGLGWTWQKYERNGQLAWCGAFAAYCFGRVGMLEAIRKKHMASCYRLGAWSKNNARRIDWKEGDIRPGDIVIVGNDRGRSWGQHITICQSFDAARGEVHTIEGNATGTLPDGRKAEGVIRKSRPLPRAGLSGKKYRVKRVIRPLPEDLAAEIG